MAHQPSKYNRNWSYPIQSTTQTPLRGVVRFDKPGKHVTRFAVQLQRQVDPVQNTYKTFAQIDHEPRTPQGHDLYQEGVHVDIYHIDGSTSKIHPTTTSSLPGLPIVLMHACKDYLTTHHLYFIQAARNQIQPSSPPKFP